MEFSLEGLALGYGIITTENYNRLFMRSITGENIEGKGKLQLLHALIKSNLDVNIRMRVKEMFACSCTSYISILFFKVRY